MNILNGNADVLRYIKENGVSLTSYGSAEFGLCKNDAMEVLKMLCERKQVILGIEVWRHIGDYFTIDSLDGWYSSSENSKDENNKSAMNFVQNADIVEDDLLTIQFE